MPAWFSMTGMIELGAFQVQIDPLNQGHVLLAASKAKCRVSTNVAAVPFDTHYAENHPSFSSRHR
jgi:hypothetical protein